MKDPVASLRRRARDALSSGDLHEVRRIIAALETKPGGAAEAAFLTGIIEAERGRISAALPLIARAASLCPRADYQAQLARLLIVTGHDDQALVSVRTAEDLAPDDALTFDTIGCVYARLGVHVDAARGFEHAVALAPDEPGFRYNLAVSLGFIGLTDRAESHLEWLVAREPTNGRAHFALSGLRRQTAGRNHIARLNLAVPSANDPADRLRLHFALGKELEECGQFAGALHHFQAGNGLRRRQTRYDFEQDVRLFDAVERAFDVSASLARTGDRSISPIFVVGLPRSGTTLVDRIISSHPLVRSAGELEAMPLALRQLAGARGPLINPDVFVRGRDLRGLDIATCYMRRVRPHLAADKGRFVDKLPANFLNVGFITRAFPAARIICLRRDPLDSVWSNFKTLFADGSTFHDYSYDLIDIARYYVRFDRLMTFWRRWSPEPVFELQYEALVGDPANEIRRLLDYCDLGWDERCLRFHENETAVATPSAAQVRQMLHPHSIGQWRSYEHALATARQVLEDAGIDMA